MAEGITGQSLAGLLDLDIESIRWSDQGCAGAIFWPRQSATMSGI
jgi:hypothetical protein